jgi:hypothetical protein
MNIREQVAILEIEGVEFVVVGGQAGVLRQAIEFSHDLDVIIHATRENAERVQRAVAKITGESPGIDLVLGRDFQQYIDEETGAELDVHLKLIAIADYESAVRNASRVDFLGTSIPVLELPALYASKRTDRPRDAVHRQAIEQRLRRLVFDGRIEADEMVLACCLDRDVAALPEISSRVPDLAARTIQPLLQARLLACGLEEDRLARNPAIHQTVVSLMSLEPAAREKLLGHAARFSALLARIPLYLPEEGYRVKEARKRKGEARE